MPSSFRIILIQHPALIEATLKTLKMKIILVGLFVCTMSCALAQQIPNQKFKKQTIDAARWTPNPTLKKVLI